MTIEQIIEMLQSPEYEFLRSNEHLKDKIIFLTLGGRMADIKAHAEGTQESRIERCVALGVLMSEILEQEKCFSLKDLAINGKDIISLGVPQGKRIGVILHELLEEVILDTLPNEHDVLLRKAVELIGRT